MVEQTGGLFKVAKLHAQAELANHTGVRMTDVMVVIMGMMMSNRGRVVWFLYINLF